MMLLPKDWRAFIELLLSNQVDYLIVGAVALAHHGRPRYTGDLDILVRTSPENARRLEAVMAEFGFAKSGLTASDFMEPDRVIQLGMPPIRIDILTSITGPSFEEAWQDRIQAEWDGIPVNIIGRRALVLNKRLTGRAQDKADLESLGAGEDVDQSAP
jgi:hypothetical protein